MSGSRWAASLRRRIRRRGGRARSTTNRPVDEQRGDRGHPAVERVLGRVLEHEGERIGGGHERQVDERGAAGEEVEGEQRDPDVGQRPVGRLRCPSRRPRPWRSRCRASDDRVEAPSRDAVVGDQEERAEERRRRGRDEQHVVVELRVARHEARRAGRSTAPAPASSAAVRAIIARVAGASTPFSDAFRQRSRSRRGGSMLLLWPMCESFGACGHHMSGSPFPPECAACGSKRQIELRARPRGFHLVTSEIVDAVPELESMSSGHRDRVHAAHVGVADDQRERLTRRAPRLRRLVRPRRPRRRRLLRPHPRGPRRHAGPHQGVADRARR